MHIPTWFCCSLTLLLLLIASWTQAAHCLRHSSQCGPESQSLVTCTALCTPIESTWLLASTHILKIHYHTQFASHHTAVIMFTKHFLDAAMTNHPWQLFVASCVVIVNIDYGSHWHAHTILLTATECTSATPLLKTIQYLTLPVARCIPQNCQIYFWLCRLAEDTTFITFPHLQCYHIFFNITPTSHKNCVDLEINHWCW